MIKLECPANVNNKYDHLVKIEEGIEVGQDIFKVYLDLI